MNIFSYVGSPRGKDSNTASVVDSLVSTLKQMGTKVSHVSYMASDTIIQNCIGCLDCMNNGICVLDADDGMKDIRKSLLMADVVIFGSPVYVHQVSAMTKTVIDRLWGWLYLLPLLGKIGVTISTSSTNGNKFVDSYLNKVLDILGCCVVSNISIMAIDPKEKVDAIIGDCCDRILDCHRNRERIVPSALQSKFFATYKDLISKTDAVFFSKSYWQDHGYFSFPDASALLKHKMGV